MIRRFFLAFSSSRLYMTSISFTMLFKYVRTKSRNRVYYERITLWTTLFSGINVATRIGSSSQCVALGTELGRSSFWTPEVSLMSVIGGFVYSTKGTTEDVSMQSRIGVPWNLSLGAEDFILSPFVWTSRNHQSHLWYTFLFLFGFSN